ncbi:rhamnulokinase [Diplocloster modestus]|uniref:Rhamnulokinase n=1 Tax=Diplocloster modestus TaxID=2850322 RepID=A0ABS6K8L5_9FIRM|nr:rhamnulokinase family protein [Diplocloster modestus]MBU9726858.1 rhamnulokinase [Diplocloster modestus]
MNMIAFDLGASSGKIYLGSFKDNMLNLKEIYRFQNSCIQMNGYLYWDIISIYANLEKGIRSCIQESSEPVVSMGLDTFSNDYGLVSKSGELLSCVHCYRDKRTQTHRQEIDRILSARERHFLTGNQIAPCNTLMHLAAMRLEDSGFMLDYADKLLFIPDLLTYFLTGCQISEYTIASVSEMFDFKTGSFHPRILDAYHIPDRLLPTVTMPGTVVGNLSNALCEEWNTDPFPVITVCEHDTASAFVSAPCEESSVIISSGTWSLVGIEMDGPVINETTCRYNLANEGGVPGRHRLMKSVMGLWILQEVQAYYNAIGMDISIPEMVQKAEAAKPYQYLIDPDDPIFFTPGNMPLHICKKCELLYNSAPSGVGELVRCVLESLAFKYRWAIEALKEATGMSLCDIHIVGGGSNNRLLNQLTADICHRTVYAGPENAAAMGNVIVQLIAHGQIKSIEEGRSLVKETCPAVVFYPREAEAEACEEQYKKFVELISK